MLDTIKTINIITIDVVNMFIKSVSKLCIKIFFGLSQQLLKIITLITKYYFF